MPRAPMTQRSPSVHARASRVSRADPAPARRRCACAPMTATVADAARPRRRTPARRRCADGSTCAAASTTALGVHAGRRQRARDARRPPLREPREVQVRVGATIARAARARCRSRAPAPTITQAGARRGELRAVARVGQEGDRRWRRRCPAARCARCAVSGSPMQFAAQRGDDVGRGARCSPVSLRSAAARPQRDGGAALSALITLSVMSTLRAGEHRLLQDQVVLLLLEDLLDHAVGALDDRGQLFVLALVQVFLELAALALEVAVLLDQLALAPVALGLGQRRRLLLELVGGAPSGGWPVRSDPSRACRTRLRAWPAPPWRVRPRAARVRC